MECPICAAQAENLTPNTLDGVVVSCGRCGPYRISGAAFYELTTLNSDGRVAALAAARVGTRGGWPTISPQAISCAVRGLPDRVQGSKR